MGSYRFILSGGGTGGHIYPAISIANELKKRYPDAEFLFVGAKDKMEMEKVPKAGYKIEGLWISGLQRKLTLKNLMFPIKLISSLFKANKIVKQFKPDLAVGTGGFASGPLLKMATQKGVPCILQEQNSFAGITNKLLSKKAKKICVAYEGMNKFFPAEKLVLTGNPVRADLVNNVIPQSEALRHFNLDPHKKTLLVLGGSLGARSINTLIDENLSFFDELGVQVLWQCGQIYFSQYQKNNKEGVKVTDFIHRMDLAYAAADVVISRAGAGSVSELCLTGKPVVFIPSPNVSEDHQTKNAQAIVDKNAAIMIKESELKSKFQDEFGELMKDQSRQKILAENILKLAKPKATEHIVDELEKYLN